MDNLLVAFLNLVSGICIAIPALRLTRDLHLIYKATEAGQVAPDVKQGLRKTTVNLLLLNASELQKKLQQWNLEDTLFLLVGIGLFIISSLISIAMILIDLFY